MAEEADNEKKVEEAPKKSKTMLFVIIGVVAVLLIGGGVAFAMMKKSDKKDVAKEDLGADAALEDGLTSEHAGEEDEAEEGEEALGAIFPLEAFVVNLEGGRYIRTQLQLEFASRDVPKRFFGKIVPIRDSIITALTKKSADDVLSDKGKENIKKEVVDIVNEMLRKEEVKRVYFTQYVVQ